MGTLILDPSLKILHHCESHWKFFKTSFSIERSDWSIAKRSTCNVCDISTIRIELSFMDYDDNIPIIRIKKLTFVDQNILFIFHAKAHFWRPFRFMHGWQLRTVIALYIALNLSFKSTFAYEEYVLDQKRRDSSLKIIF